MPKKTKPKTSNDYWINRALKREQESYLMGQELNKALLEKYRGSSSEIRKQITDFYTRYANENGLTYDDAVKIINRDEYREFKKSLDEYVKEYTTETDPRRAAILKAKVDAMAYRSRITRLEAVNTQIECTIDKLYLESVNELNKGFEKVFKNSFKGKMLDIVDRFKSSVVGAFKGITKMFKGPKDTEKFFKGKEINFSEKFIDDKIVKDVISYPWCGNHFSDRLWKNKENLIFNMRDILSRGLLQGTSLPQMAKEMAEKTGQSYKTAYNLVETETTHFHEEANFRAYEAAGIEKYQFWSEHELSVCSTCADLDMKVFDVKDRKEGINAPPIHPRCRCVTVEYDPEEKEDYINSGLEPPEDRETWQQWYDGEVKRRGEEAVEADLKMYRNRSADSRQFEEYKNVLGAKNLPKNLDEFQKLKYNDSEYYKFIKLDYLRQNELLNNPDLKLPNAEKATADDRKFTMYLFNTENKKGWAKGQAIKNRLGYSKENFKELKSEILKCASAYPAIHKGTDEYGDSYEQKIVLYGLRGTPANMILGWKVKDNNLWLTSAYIKEVKE